METGTWCTHIYYLLMNSRMSKWLNKRLVGLSEAWKTYRDFWKYWDQVMKGFECWHELIFHSIVVVSQWVQSATRHDKK